MAGIYIPGMTVEEYNDLCKYARYGANNAMIGGRKAIHVPAADVVERKSGSWIEDGYYNEPCVCSYCGEPGKPEWRFCPNCGAIMDGGNDDDYGCVSV